MFVNARDPDIYNLTGTGTHDWRYTAWFRFTGSGARGPYRRPAGAGGAGAAPDYFGRVVVGEGGILGRELYDHRGDSGMWLDWPGENANLVNNTEHAAVVEVLHQRLLDYIQIK